MLNLPFLTHQLPPIGGRLKALPEHFIVTEIMEPRTDRVEEAQFDTGKHAFVTVRRKGLSTPQMQRALAEVFGVRPDEIGYAGLKDMRAIATQTFSLPRDRLLPPELRQPDALDAIAGCLRADRRFELVEAGDTGEASVAHDCAPAWHMCKLRIGELSGNRFDIIVSDTCVPPRVALERATLIAERLRRTGWANYYGPQRFGKAGVEHSVRRGVELLRNRMGTARKSDANAHRGWIGTLMLNALQSALFNAYLAERMRRGLFETVLVGDLVAPPHSASAAAKPRMEARAAAVQREDDGAEAVDGLVAADGAVATKIAATGTGPLSSVRRKRFTVSTLAAGRFPLVCFADDDPDPLSVALELLDDAAASADAMPSVARLVPVQGTCAATVEGIAEALTPLLARSVPEGATSFAVHWKTRRRSGCPPLSLDRSAAISAILTCVAEQVAGATVDLGAPDVTIHVEVLQEADMCCLSVLPQWAQRAEYSLRKEVDVGEGAASA